MKKYAPRFIGISFLIFIISTVIYILSIRFSCLAELVNTTLSTVLRRLLSYTTYLLPFSFFELLILLLPVIVGVAIFLAVKRGRDTVEMVRYALSILALISLLFTSYIYTLGIGYHTPDISEKTGIEDRTLISAEELYYTAGVVLDELNAIAEHLELHEGSTEMPYSVDDLSEGLVHAFDTFLAEYPIFTNYTSRVKPIYFSTVMSDLGISGIYSFFTGEANVNVEYPDYCLPFTAAHEMAHQRGVCRENEASFVAFLVAIGSDDEYIRYSGYLNIYEYLASALYSASPELYAELNTRLHPTARADILAARDVYNLHKDSVLGKINERLNDAYLKANGTDGVVSYGYVVRLAVGYYIGEK